MGSIKEAKENWIQTQGVTNEAATEEKCYTCSLMNAQNIKSRVFNLVVEYLEKRKEGPMAKVVLITAQECAPCEEAREAIRDKIEAGAVEEINFDSCEDCEREAILASGINAFPYMAIKNEDGSFIEPMKLASEQRLVKAEQPEVPYEDEYDHNQSEPEPESDEE